MSFLSVANSDIIKALSEEGGENGTISLNDLIDLYAQIVANESNMVDDETLQKFICKKVSTYCDLDTTAQENSKIISGVKESTNNVIQAIRVNDMGALESASKELEEYQTRIQALEKEVYTDELTTCLNRRYLLANKLEEGKRFKTDGTVFILNVPNFKELNQQYGYVIGDSVLKYIALQIKRMLIVFECDIVRFTGAVFMIFVKESGRADAIAAKLGEFQNNLKAHKYKTSSDEVISFNFVFGHTDYRQGEPFEDAIDMMMESLA